MGKQYVLVEYHHDGRTGTEYPLVFIGDLEECQSAMLARLGMACTQHSTDKTCISCVANMNDKNAHIQDELGTWRIEWWIVEIDECKNYLPQIIGGTK